MTTLKSFADLKQVMSRPRLGIDARLKVKAALDGSLLQYTPRAEERRIERAREERRIERAMAAPVDNTPLFTNLPPRHVGTYRKEEIRRTRPKRPLVLEESFCLAHPRVAAAMYAAWNEDREFELLY